MDTSGTESAAILTVSAPGFHSPGRRLLGNTPCHGISSAAGVEEIQPVSIPSAQNATAVTDRNQLVELLESGCKPREDWRVGTEHEKFAYDATDFRPLAYDAPNGIRTILDELQRFGWKPLKEGENTIGLKKDNQHVSLEPGGQVELSGAPLRTLHETCREVNAHLDQCQEIAEELGIIFLGLGLRPRDRREDVPWMPKGRYRIMRSYMPRVGALGIDMMIRTCTIQANLDFGSEADMVRKFRVGQALQAVATALFANSPFTEGKPNGYLSMRAHIWTDTDDDRSGILKFVTEDGFGFERYVDYALDVPMYFVMRDGRYIDASGQSFRDFMNGRLPALPGEIPTLSDWEDHLTTLFPDVRIKRYMEVRGADGASWRRICALPALWTGLFYEPSQLDAAWDLVKGLDLGRAAPDEGGGAAHGPQGALPFRNRPGHRPGDAGDLRRRPAPAALLRRQPGRGSFPRFADGDRGVGPHARGGAARPLRERLEPQDRTRVHRVFVLTAALRQTCPAGEGRIHG